MKPRILVGALVTVASCRATPARLTIDNDQVVINNYGTVLMPVRAINQRGDTLGERAVHYRWLSGDAIPLSDSGDVTCSHRADAEAMAIVDGVARRFVLRCRPVATFSLKWSLEVHAGGHEALDLGHSTAHRNRSISSPASSLSATATSHT